MILLQGQSLAAKEQFTPESMSLSLEERRSTANMTLGPDAPAMAVGDWLRDDTEPGSGIIWRIKGIDTQIDTETRTVQMEHIVNTLKDTVMFGEHTGANMGGTDAGCTAKQAIQYILSKTALWTLGTYEHPAVSNPYKFEGDSLMAALETVSTTLEDPFWEYDLSVLPFKLHIRKITDTAVESEMRMTRNIQTLRRTVDRSRMYTRLYPIGYNDLHISGNYIERNTGTYGVIEHVETNQGATSEGELRMWANGRLKRHCEPSVTVTVAGMALAADTGEALDRLTLGRKCRVPLPEYDTTITEVIKRLQYRDKIRNPEQVSVTMANLQEDVASLYSQQSNAASSAARGGGAAGRKKAEEDHAWFVDTTEHVGMVAEAIIGRDPNGVDWSRVSSIIVDGTGIHQTVKETSDTVVRQQTAIEQNERKISLEAKNRENADKELTGKIEVEAGKISQIVEAVGSNGQVTAASIVLAINNGGSSARISADQILLDGNTTINSIMSVSSGSVVIKKPLRVESSVMASSVQLRSGGSGITLTDTNMATAIKSATVTNNVLTLTRFDGTKLDFSKATSLSGRWSSNKFTVTAKQGSTTVGTLTTSVVGSITNIAWTGGNQYGYYGKGTLRAAIGSGNPADVGTVLIDAKAAYAAGRSSVSHNISAGSIFVNYSNPGGTRIGGTAIPVSALQSGANYLTFTISCGSASQRFYVQVTK